LIKYSIPALLICLLIAIFTDATAHYIVRGQAYEVLATSKGFTQQGVASWYGEPFHGRKTANGETYDMHKLTAAHKTLPLPTNVLVENLDNGKQVFLKVNDRGPFHGDRVIDLSYAAAGAIGMLDQGLANVRITVEE
tara:strand:- start:3112 stop:3522 length:411 start_codon:yes stop_codon:yes gene_type:complete